LQYIKKGFTKNNFSNYEIILIDCNEKSMVKRLKKDRKQPELVNQEMKNWLAFLRKQAKDLKVKIIDTTNTSEEEKCKRFEKILEKEEIKV
jgi:RNase adaptor protein for sRNA GlmZ degradation